MLKKIILTIREKGLGYLMIIGWSLIQSSFRSAFVYPLQRKVYISRLHDIPIGDRVFLWTQDFGWNVPLLQRPQHIARCLADKNCTVFYCTSPLKDSEVDSIVQIYPNLYLVNKQNKVLIEELENYLAEVTTPKYLHLYSTHYRSSTGRWHRYCR